MTGEDRRALLELVLALAAGREAGWAAVAVAAAEAVSGKAGSWWRPQQGQGVAVGSVLWMGILKAMGAGDSQVWTSAMCSIGAAMCINRKMDPRWGLGAIVVAGIGMALLHVHRSMVHVLSLLCFFYTFSFIAHYLSLVFTAGEAILAAHVFSTLVLLTQSMQPRLHLLCMRLIVLLVSIPMVIRTCRAVRLFDLLVLCAILYATAGYTLHEEPLQWLVSFLLTTPRRTFFVLCWLAALSIAIPMIIAASARLRPILVRKLFHLLAVFLFTPVIQTDPSLMMIAFTAAMLLFVMAEYLRLIPYGPVATRLNAIFRRFLDARDQGNAVVSHQYLLVGCAAPFMASPFMERTSALLPLIGVVTVGVGDSMASAVGSSFGTHVWLGSRKTVEGMLSGWIAMVLFQAFLLIPVTPTTVVLFSLCALFETTTSQNDNIYFPMFAVLLFSAYSDV